MDKILGYVLENFRQLTPFHLLLVFLLALLASSGMFFVFRWLFTSRLEAQRELLQMRSEQITELKSRFAELKLDGAKISQELELAQATGSLAPPSPGTSNLELLSALRVRLALIALMWFHNMQEFRVSLWSLLEIYAELDVSFRTHLPSAPTAEQFRVRLEHATDPFRTADVSPSAFQRFEPAVLGDASAPYPTGLIEFPFNETWEALRAFRQEIDGWLEELFQKIDEDEPPSLRLPT